VKDKNNPHVKSLLATLKVTDDINNKLSEELRTKGDYNALLSEDLRKKQDQLQIDAAKDLVEKIIKHKEKVRSNIGIFDDGDQSPLNGDDAQFLKNQWASGMDCNPLFPQNNHLSGWLRALWWGDYTAVMTYINKVKKDQVKKLLESRESLMNLSAIFHVIAGARTLRGENEQLKYLRLIGNLIQPVKEDHEKIMKKLIELGANIHAKDVAGYTPLHHCLTGMGNSITRSMARELLQAGADPNAQNRFGNTPLMEPVQAFDLENIKLLLEFGADPDIDDNDGVSCRHIGFHSSITKLFGQAEKKKIKQARAAAKEDTGGCLWLCKVCKSDSDTKRCTGCYMVWYCGGICQNKDWPNHKDECKKIKTQYKDIVLMDETNTLLNYANNEFYVTKADVLPTKKHFSVKIQVPQDGTQGPLLIYNRDRSLVGNLHRLKQEEIYDALVKTIKDKGYKGLKGYFYAILSGNCTQDGNMTAKVLKVNPLSILPLMSW